MGYTSKDNFEDDNPSSLSLMCWLLSGVFVHGAVICC